MTHPAPSQGLLGSIGQTPLIRLQRASAATGCEILGKAEFMNPGGSVKDRAAQAIILGAEARGELKPGGTLVEGTAGNTGIGLTLVGNARGYRCVIVMPETQSQEKIDFLRMIGADLQADPGQAVQGPRQLRARLAPHGRGGGLVLGQPVRQPRQPRRAPSHHRRRDHRAGRRQGGCLHLRLRHRRDAGRRSLALKAHDPSTRIVLADPLGSALYDWRKSGEVKMSEGTSITEGIGQSRVPANLQGVEIDDAVQLRDEAALEQVFDLTRHEGLCIGGSAGINVAAAIAVAKQMGPGHRVVTILCDGGARYQSKLFNPDFLRSKGLPAPPWLA
jgi:cysteine synthase A